MTEAEWLAATDPRPMLEYLEPAGIASARSCACSLRHVAGRCGLS
jgi:hypothetical protein